MASIPLPECDASVHIPDLSALAFTGVYFLISQGRVVYVGQAVDVRRRIADHIGEAVKKFDSVRAMAVDRDRLTPVERRYIRRFRPKYNSCSTAKAAKALPTQIVKMSKRDAMEAMGIDSVEAFDALEIPKRRMPRSSAIRYLIQVSV